jgi:penicillin amidase
MTPSYAGTLGSPRRSRKRRWPPIVLWLFAGLLGVVLLTSAAGLVWLRAAEKTALPVLDGELHINSNRSTGISAPVTVRRDGHGVPHIEAATQEDLFTAQGYVTAQDRLWQMDAFRRNAKGELAEVLGPSLVKHDRMQRVLQMGVTAQRIYTNLPAADRARMDEYARGVNLFIDAHQDALPAEFRLLHYRPAPWTGQDSVAIGLMMVQMLDTHWDVKLERELISLDLHNAKLEADLYPVGSWRDRPPTGILVDLSQPHPEPAPAPDEDDDDDDDDRSQAQLAVPKVHEDFHRLHALLGLAACANCTPGSNNWVVAGKHTASGKPLLSNDMHLPLTEPNIWFMADLRAPGFHAAGVTLAGVPFVIAGHNEHVAWGFTALYADVQDLYVEKLDGNGHYQALDGEMKPLGVDHEVIHVRGGKDVELDVQSTEHGPLLNPLLLKEKRAISLRWTLYDTTLNTLPLYEMNTAANWKEFSASLETWCWPTQNLVYSDDQGHIAYQAVGRVPLRPLGLKGVPIRFEPSAGTNNDWQGYIPFGHMPAAFDPPAGLLATANARVTTAGSQYPLSLEWADPYRTQRIYKALQGRDKLTAADMLAVETDIYSEVDQEIGHRLAYAIDHTAEADDRLKKAADLMRSWDGRLTTDSAAASIVTEARRAFWPLILAPKLGKDGEEYRWSESNFAEEEIIMHGYAEWLPSTYKNWDALLTDAVRRGMDSGKAPGDVTLWRYGKWHVVDIEHPLADFLPLISRMAGTGPQPLSGDTTTVKQVGRDFGPSQRFTMDWSNIDGSTENIALGESSDPFSAYFRDQWQDYYGGTTFALPFSAQAVAAETSHTLRLLP